MRFSGAARQSRNQTARILIPVRRAETCKSRNKINSAVVRNGIRQSLDIIRFFDDSQAVSEPPDNRAADKNAAFERVFAFFTDLPGDGREQTVFRFYSLFADILQHKT